MGEIATYQARPDNPRARRGKAVKYETAAGTRMVLDVHPAARQLIGNPAVPLFVTEGVKKADAITSRGGCAVALLGVWNWRGTNGAGGRTALADWEYVAVNGRRTYIVFDSDVMLRDEVHRALVRLKAFLEGRGAEVGLIYLPSGPHAEKVGVDDHLAAGADLDDLLTLATSEPRTPLTAELPARVGPSIDDESRSQATALVEIASCADLFCDRLGDAYAAFEIGGHRETWAVRSTGFRRWLVREYYSTEHKAPKGSSVADALTVIEARAQFEGDERPVWRRVAEDDSGAVYIDLGSPTWDAVRIAAAGWESVSDPPVHFRRGASTGRLPRPLRGGSLRALSSLLNLKREEDFRRVVGWLLGALRPRGPYPLLAFIAEQGSGKSFAARLLRTLVDPAAVALRGMPREERDLVIAARVNHVVALDNVSTLPQWLSDALCRVASGAGWATRRLYTDADEEVFSESRPIIMTGIEDFIANGDLLDRALLVSLQAIAPRQRKQEAELLREFEEARPAIFGALLDAVSVALRNLPNVRLSSLPRMADFAAWITAAEEALPWPAGGFMDAYAQGIANAHDVVLEASLIADPLQTFASECGEHGWEGSSADLLSILNSRTPEGPQRRRAWPSSPRALAGELRRLAPTLRNVGLDLTFEREASARRKRLIVIRRVDDEKTVQTVRPESDSVDGDRPDVDGPSPTVDGQGLGEKAGLESTVDGVDGVDGEFAELSWEREVV